MQALSVDQKTLSRINHDFDYHAPPDQETKDRHAMIRGTFRDLAMVVVTMTPPSREQSLAITKLEEAMMWANAAIARNHSAAVTPT